MRQFQGLELGEKTPKDAGQALNYCGVHLRHEFGSGLL